MYPDQDVFKLFLNLAICKVFKLNNLLISNTTSHQMLREKVFLPEVQSIPSQELVKSLMGEGGSNLQFIRESTGVRLVLKGVGSGSALNIPDEKGDPLHFYIEYVSHSVVEFLCELSYSYLLEYYQITHKFRCKVKLASHYMAIYTNIHLGINVC